MLLVGLSEAQELSNDTEGHINLFTSDLETNISKLLLILTVRVNVDCCQESVLFQEAFWQMEWNGLFNLWKPVVLVIGVNVKTCTQREFKVRVLLCVDAVQLKDEIRWYIYPLCVKGEI